MEMVLFNESSKSMYVVNEIPYKDSTMDATRRSGEDSKVTSALQGKTKLTFQQF